MVFSVPENVKRLWELWNVRGFIILSLSVQVFLILFAPLRKQRRGKWGRLDILTWTTYLLADWIAGVAIGAILTNQIKTPGKNSDIQAFWAPFLLLHLGGPDTITSYALEDNEFWVRHLLGLALQIASTAYVFLMSLPNNHLWLSTVLVLITGIIKYGERSRAFYLASFEQLGENWVPSEWGDELPIPVEFLKVDEPAFDKPAFAVPTKSILWYAVHHFGTIKMLLVGPYLSRDQCAGIRETFSQRSSSEVLRIMEIELSLLYEVLHTKLPVVGCKIGYILRAISMGCIVGGLMSFSYYKKHYQLEFFDILLTYGLLVGALLLDLIAIMLLLSSDWILITHLQNLNSSSNQESNSLRDSISKLINRPRWSAEISQLNFITYYVKDHQGLLKLVAACFPIPRLWKAVKRNRCLSSQDLIERQEWDFIFSEVKELNDYLSKKLDSSRSALEAKEVWQYSRDRALEKLKIPNQLLKIIEEFDYTKSVLTWHIATELCFQGEEHKRSASQAGGRTDIRRRKMAVGFDYEALCKLFSDYMFYLIIMQPSMMSAVAVSCKIVFQNTLDDTKLVVGRGSISGENEATQKILQLKPSHSHPERDIDRSVLFAASALAKELLKQTNGCPWDLMCMVWVQLMCFAAINCRPNVHAQQPSKGGELLTFIWLLMNHEGLGTHFSSHF